MPRPRHSGRYRRRTKSLKAFLKDADERVKEAAVDALNASAERLQAEIVDSIQRAGITEHTGGLRESIKIKPATVKTFNAYIDSEYMKEVPKHPGSRNPNMEGRYKNGAPVSRILEFSPRYNKPFFYSTWYTERDGIRQYILAVIGDAWSGKIRDYRGDYRGGGRH